MLAGISAAGYRHVGWHVDGEDWKDDCTPEALASTVLDGSRRAGNGAVVLLHAWPASTPEAVRLVLEAGSREGMAFVGIDELGVKQVEPCVRGRACSNRRYRRPRAVMPRRL